MNTTLEAMNATFEKLIGTPKGPPYAHTCQICGKEYENGERWDVYLACGPVCLAAVEAKEAQHAEACRLKRIANLRAEAAASVKNAAPPRLVNTDLGHAGFNRKAWAVVSKWTPTDECPWLGLVGVTGACKTRMAILRALEVFADMTEARDTRLKFEYSSAYEIARHAIAQYSDDKEEKYDSIRSLEAIRRADLIIVDDIDKTRFTPAITEVIFELFDMRHGRGKPTIWTANTTAEEIGGMMAPQFGPAFAGRLNDCSKTFTLK